MNVLPFEKRVQIASLLVDGASIRAAERMLGIHRDSIMRFGIVASVRPLSRCPRARHSGAPDPGG